MSINTVNCLITFALLGVKPQKSVNSEVLRSPGK